VAGFPSQSQNYPSVGSRSGRFYHSGGRPRGALGGTVPTLGGVLCAWRDRFAPDAVAAKAVLQDLPLPRRIIVLLEGESLVNDASGLVLYRFAVTAALTGAFDANLATITFTVLAVGGVAVGVAFGWLVTVILKRLRDPTLSVLASFLAAWAAYIGGEAVHVSGVLSTVACGLVIGWRQHKVLTAATRIEALAVLKVAAPPLRNKCVRTRMRLAGN
jgi:Sodium/hydrogen exchanger family